jgi:putative heme-binding domain-containing protein
VLAGRQSNETKLDVIRVLQVGLGDVGGGAEKTAPVFEGYAPRFDFTAHAETILPVVNAIEKIFPTGDPVLDREIGRTLAMISCSNESLFDKVVSHLRSDTDPIDDLHYLTVAARMPVKRNAAHQRVIARALVDIEKKIRSQGRTQDNNWADRFGELFTGLLSHDPGLYQALLKVPGFGRPSHVMFLAHFPEEAAEEALAAFKREIAADADYPWNNDVVFVFGMKDEPESREILRSLCDRPGTASAAVMVLADHPAAEDRGRYVDGLNNGSLEVVQACLDALEKLPEEKSGNEIVSLIKLIRRLGVEKSDYALRNQAVQHLKRCTGQEFGFEFGEAGYKPQSDAVEKWTAYAMQEFPELAATMLGASETDLTTVRETVASIPWDSGDETRGKAVFTARSCAQCHSGSTGLGPDLVGATARFSKQELFTAIMLPNRDVSPRYQTTVVETKSGKTYTGLIVYESVDGVLLRNGLSQTQRIEAVDIESQRTLPTSIMPADLLKGATPGELADLYAYLRSLSPRSTAGVPSNGQAR